VAEVKEIVGTVVISEQLLEQSRATDRAFREMEWIALNYDQATDEQRARFDAWEKHFDEMADEGYFG
jgi:hypothetical protein